MEFLKELLAGVKVSEDVYNNFRGRIIGLIIWSLVALAAAIGLNFLGLKVINTFIGCVLPIAIIYIFTNPSILEAVIGAGIVSELTSPVQGSKKALEKLAAFVCWILLWVSIFFLVAGTFSFSRHPLAIPAILLSIIVLFLMGYQWGTKSLSYRKILRSYAVIILVVGTGSLVSGARWTTLIGFDPYGFARLSEIDETVYKIEQADRNAQENDLLSNLKRIEKQIENGTRLADLPEADRKLWDSQKKQRDQRTLPGKAKEGWNKVSKVISPPNSESEEQDKQMRNSVDNPNDHTWNKIKKGLSGIFSSDSTNSTTPHQKEWVTVVEKTVIGIGVNGKVEVPIAKFGSEIKYGDKIIITSSSSAKFFVSDGGKWVDCINQYSQINQAINGWGDLYIAANKGEKISLKLERLF